MDALKFNTELRSFLVENGIPRDFLPALQAANVLTQPDGAAINKEIGDPQQMIMLLDKYCTRTQSIIPLMNVLKSLPDTYGPAIKLIEEHNSTGYEDFQDSISWEPTALESLLYQPHIAIRVLLLLCVCSLLSWFFSSSYFPILTSLLVISIPVHIYHVYYYNIETVSEHIKESYRKQFSKFKTLPVYGEFSIDQIWINLQLEGKRGRGEPENYLKAIMKALQGSSFVLLKGEPGMGKTMTQKRLAYGWAVGEIPQYDLVLCARFRSVKKRWKSVWKLTLNWMLAHGYILPAQAQWLHSNIQNITSRPKSQQEMARNIWSRITNLFKCRKLHVLCVADGLDEKIADCLQLEKILHSSDSINLSSALLVTSRPWAIENVPCPAPTLVFTSLNDEQIHQCICKYVKSLTGPEEPQITTNQERDRLTQLLQKAEDLRLKKGISPLIEQFVGRMAPLVPQLDLLLELEKLPDIGQAASLMAELQELFKAHWFEMEIMSLVLKLTEYEIHHLAQSPLLLSCLCFIRDKISSDSVVEIYLNICQALVGRQEDPEERIKFTQKTFGNICAKHPSVRALSQMCLAALTGDQGFQPGTVLFTNEDLDGYGVNKDLWLKIGLLSADREEEMGEADALYQLPHVTFMELLSAAAVFEKLSLSEYECPQYPEFSTVQSRLSSFTGWPEETKQQPIDMAKAGFYYTGDGDKVKCFYCAESLINWESKDVPLWDHALNMPSCPYLLLVKGKAFVDFVQKSKDSGNVDELAQTHGHLHITNYDKIDEKIYHPQSEPILKQVWGVMKSWSLEQMWKFLLEMAAQSEETSNRAINNTVSFFEAWCRQRHINLATNQQFFQLFMRLLPKTKEGLKQQLADRIRVQIHLRHTPSSLLFAASRGQIPMYKLSDHAVYLRDLDTVLLVEKHDCRTEIQVALSKRQLYICLAEQNVLDALPHTCMQMGWEQIHMLIIHVTEEQIAQQEPHVEENKLSVKILQFYFKLGSQSVINVSPLFNRPLVMNAKQMVLRSDNVLIIGDIPMLFSNEKLKQQVEYIELEKIQFQNKTSAAQFAEEMKNYEKLYIFKLYYSKIGGVEFLKLIDNLTNCPISLLYISEEHCLEDVSIVDQFVHLLPKFSNLEGLRCTNNNLSSASIDRLCESIKKIRTLKQVTLEDDNVKFQHLQLLRNAGLKVNG